MDQEPTGRPPPLGREMSRHAHMSHDRESELYSDQRPPLKV